ncbi:MAG: hypothetical protein KGQ70_05695 [Alphaproteobacteria bacterium]|nr:hypothetical protein [Alphaproteobacteria bacterium]
MPITLEDLDGSYQVSSETSLGGPFIVNGDGVTVIKNGLTYRKDDRGCIWESAFSVIGEGQVRIESTVDPSHAGKDMFILDAQGNPTKGTVTYKSVLEARVVEGKIVLSGVISHGQESTRLTMKKV